MRLRTALFAVAGIAFAGCTESALNPGDKVTMTGQALNEDKSPIPNTQLTLSRSDNNICFPLHSFSSPLTDQSGNFTQALVGSDTQSGNLARCFELGLPVGQDGSVAYHDFFVQVTDVKVPALQRWTGQLAQTPDNAGGTSVSFKSIADTHGFTSPSHSLEIRTGESADDIWWKQDNATSPIALDKYVLEDVGTLKANLVVSNEQKGSGTAFHGYYGSSKLPVQGTAKPVSRGANCSFAENQACGLTDGKATLQLAPQNTFEAKITLPAAKLLKKAVFRGFSVNAAFKTITVEGSPDGTTFTTLASISDPDQIKTQFFEVDLTGTTAVSVVRVKGVDQSNNPLELNGFRELSLFE